MSIFRTAVLGVLLAAAMIASGQDNRPSVRVAVVGLTAYDFSAKKDLLAQLLSPNQQVAAKMEKGELVMPPGVARNYPDATKLVTEHWIRPHTG